MVTPPSGMTSVVHDFGSAGGHREMVGGEIPRAIFTDQFVGRCCSFFIGEQRGGPRSGRTRP